MGTIIDFVKGLVAKSPTRLIAYSSALAVTGALKLAEFTGVELSAEILAGVAALAALITTELIRRFVYSPNSVQNIANEAARTGSADIGSPPEGEK